MEELTITFYCLYLLFIRGSICQGVKTQEKTFPSNLLICCVEFQWKSHSNSQQTVNFFIFCCCCCFGANCGLVLRIKTSETRAVDGWTEGPEEKKTDGRQTFTQQGSCGFYWQQHYSVWKVLSGCRGGEGGSACTVQTKAEELQWYIWNRRGTDGPIVWHVPPCYVWMLMFRLKINSSTIWEKIVYSLARR